MTWGNAYLSTVAYYWVEVCIRHVVRIAAYCAVRAKHRIQFVDSMSLAV